jgi:hypothetical protein
MHYAFDDNKPEALSTFLVDLLLQYTETNVEKVYVDQFLL